MLPADPLNCVVLHIFEFYVSKLVDIFAYVNHHLFDVIVAAGIPIPSDLAASRTP